MIKNLKYIVFLLTLFWQALMSSAQETIPLNSAHSFTASQKPGYTYSWWYTDASGTKTMFTSTSHKTEAVIWNKEGAYQLFAQARDENNCLSEIITKNFVVAEVVNNRSVAFLTTTSATCYSGAGNGFALPLLITGSDGLPLTAGFFPVVTEFTLNGKSFTQQVSFNSQVIQLTNDQINADEQTGFIANVEITGAKDNQNNSFTPHELAGKHTRTIKGLSFIDFTTAAALVEQGSQLTHEVEMLSGNPQNAVYHWQVVPANGTSTNLGAITETSATILWDGLPEMYNLQVYVTDVNGCNSETISLPVEVTEPSGFNLSAGKDTTIGSCQTYQLHAVVKQEAGVTYTYNWKPANQLDDAAKSNPLFTPGSTTMFVVTVNGSNGKTATDSVKISVSPIVANAGSDVFMLVNSTTILDGSASKGRDLKYQWSTLNGKIDSGANTAKPVVSGFGAYFMKVTDEFGCIDTDTVTVTLLAQAPVAEDDYDTTAYRTETIIAVLDNDYDPQNGLNPASLKIISSPVNGTAYVDFNNYSIRYRPKENFSGTEMFEYEICNTAKLCDVAKVFVMVTDFEFRIPNAFTPNGDDINDFFEIIGIEKYPNNAITVVNRWGYRVYEAQSYGVNSTPKFWDGYANVGSQFMGNKLPTGTYFYTIDLGNGTKPIVGSIYLDR